MEGKQKYRIELFGSLINNYSKIIIGLYMPLIGANATCLYLLLTSEKQLDTYSTLERLCCLTGMDIESLEKSIISLEQYALLKTYQKDDKYLFEVKPPLSGKEFFNHNVFARMYLNKVGQIDFSTSKRKYCISEYDREGFVDVSHSLDLSSMENWDYDDEKCYQETNQNETEIAIDFDYDTFLDITTTLIFPISERTKENLTAIGKLATLYCISAKNMKSYVKKSMDYENTNKLDLEKLKRYCLADKKTEVKQTSDPYSLSPVAFLYELQKVPVSVADKKLLEYLQVDCHLNNEVINYLVEYALKATGGKLAKEYVEKVATTWVRQGVDSKEKAMAASEISYNPSKQSNKKKVSFSKDEMEVAEQDLEALRNQMFGKKG